LQFAAPTDAKKVTFDDEKAPVFSLEKMIQDEAEKLKIQVGHGAIKRTE
jgi:hypothetical protein